MKGTLPQHIAFIMDGNGRWARRRGLPRLHGHRRGAKTVRQIVEELIRVGIPEGTFYALSCENYAKRPQSEISRLFELLVQYLDQEAPVLMRERIRLVVIGRRTVLPAEVRRRIRAVERRTADHDRFTLRLAVNYGSRQEIWDGILALARDLQKGKQSVRRLARMSPEALRAYLYDPEMSDPDLLIRTGGQARLSNFLLWHIPYCELYITEVLWPAFREKHLREALARYARRDRKFGALS